MSINEQTILILSYEEIPSFIGLTTRIINIAKALNEKGIAVELAAPNYRKGKSGIDIINDLKVHQISMPKFFRKYQIPILTRIAFVIFYTFFVITHFFKQRIKFRYVQSEQIYPFWASYCLSKIWNTTLILDDPAMLEFFVEDKLGGKTLTGKTLKVLISAFERFSMKNADYIVCSSKRSLDYFMKKLNHFRDKFVYLPNGVDEKEFCCTDRTESKNRLFFNCSLPYYQNMAALKNVLLITGFLDQHEFREYSLEIVVNNIAPLPEDMKEEIESNPRIFIRSAVPSLVPHLQEADVVLFPYETGHYTTAGSRLKALEALSCGKIVFSTPEGVDGIDSLVHGKNFILCQNVETMMVELLRFLSEGEYCSNTSKDIRTGARKLITEKYAWSKLLEKYDIPLLSLKALPKTK